ncbi:NUDIX hydrolase [Nocardiopsis sediminis]|uniref:NUDIX hydrolase n=1 Tax=Nocardiopsis sediminis TaxID=1778267 RepID=A0ABV8FYH2_9ACTN
MTTEHPPAGDTADGHAEPVEPRPAATVVLLREGAAPPGAASGGIEVYLLRRARTMPFAPGAYAFPGGRVDPRDADHGVRWAGPSPGDWAAVLGAAEPLARSLVCAAVRETFEESGVLLAGASAAEVVADTRGDDWEADRTALIDRSLSFSDFLDRRGLVLRSDLLKAWSHWITPRGEPRRFDTRFFVAVLPVGQQTRDVGGEADRVVWMRPADAVAGWRDGSLPMLPPTSTTCRELAGFAAPDAAMAARRTIAPILPELRRVGGRTRIVVPGDTGCPPP